MRRYEDFQRLEGFLDFVAVIADIDYLAPEFRFGGIKPWAPGDQIR